MQLFVSFLVSRYYILAEHDVAVSSDVGHSSSLLGTGVQLLET